MGSGTVAVSSGSLAASLSSTSKFAGTFVISNGGTLEVTSSGATVDRPIDFAATVGTLQIDGTTMPSDVISGPFRAG